MKNIAISGSMEWIDTLIQFYYRLKKKLLTFINYKVID